MSIRRRLPVALLIGLVGASPAAPAFTLDCAGWLVKLSDPQHALAKFERRAARLRAASGRGDRFSTVVRDLHHLFVDQTSRLLARHDLDCREVQRALDRHHVVLSAPGAAFRLMERLCAGDVDAVDQLTRHAFESYVGFIADARDAIERDRLATRVDHERRHLRRWLDRVVDAKVFSGARWLELLEGRPERILPLAEVLDGKFARAGLGAADVSTLARALIDHGFPIDTLILRLRLGTAALREFASRLDPLQALGLRRFLKGTLTTRDLDDFEVRLARRPRRYPVGSPALRGAVRMLSDLVYDPAVPFALVQRVDRALETHGERVYGGPVRPTFDPKSLTAARIARARNFFGRAIVDRAQVLVEKKRFAGYVEAKLRHASFESVERFVEVFRLANVYQPAREEKRTSVFVPETILEEQAVAKAYFRVLRDHLDEVLAMSPKTSQLRFILETPLQFRHLEAPRPRDSRWSSWTSRLRPDTFEDYRRIHARVLRYARHNLASLVEWKELMLYQARPEPEYERLKADGIERMLDLGLALGDKRGDRGLEWLELVEWDLRHDTKHLGPSDSPRVFQLSQLRRMVPTTEVRTKGLERKALGMLALTPLLLTPERRRFDARKSEVERNLIEMYELFGARDLPGDPVEVGRALRRLREGLLAFLAVRSSNERTLVVDRAQFDRLVEVAADCNYEIILIREGSERMEIAVFPHSAYL